MEIDDREWEAFVKNALGLSVSESGMLLDLGPQQDLTS
jgi:hypothetical protein